MRTFICCLLLLGAFTAFAQNSIYTHQVSSIFGSVIDFNDFRGKKILIVNTASGSDRNVQIQQLNNLCQLFKDSGLIVVAFPSNDFAHESKSNEELANLYQSVQPNFFIAEKSVVKGSNMSSVYEWLSKKDRNGVMDGQVKGDFQKFYIDRSGKIVAVYSGSLSAQDTAFINFIRSH